jgi:hypothetical protein
MTVRSKAGNFLLFTPNDDVQIYLQRWLAQNLLQMDALFDPVNGQPVAADKDLRAYIQRIMAVLDPGGPPPPPP